MLSETEIKQHLKQAFWDVNYSVEDLYAVFTKETTQINAMTLERIYVRLLECYSWYKIINIVPQEQLLEMIGENIIKKLRFEQLKTRYRNVRELLQFSIISITG